MSIHSSLRSAGAGRKHRSVLKRYERLKVLKDKNVWDEGKTVLGIPKVKMQKLKVKKEKAAATPAAGGATAPAAGGAAKPAAAAGAAKPATTPAAKAPAKDKK